MTTTLKAPPAGGAFLLGPTDPADVFTPERFTPEQLAAREAIATFVAREVAPRAERIEAKDYEAQRELLAILGRDGYVGIDVPEGYGGLGLDQVTSTVVTDAVTEAGDFSVTYSAHTGIGTL
ncbi:MAG TPA: acyl-CoA dehydrogenase family protein, partial [Candidatus Sulfotelmatobacter sp.]|nr:acyl-CoA dehydrogenase family protein [Candidatus Sulfotelmatobacter sp.]